METINAITLSRRDPSRVKVQVDNRVVATVPAGQVEALGLTVGAEWDDELARRVADAEAFDRCCRVAMRKLNRRAMRSGALAEALRGAGHDAAVVDRAIAHLESVGALDDKALARVVAEETVAKKPAGPALVRDKLRRRGFDEDTALRAADEVLRGGDTLADARRLATKRLRGLARFDRTTQYRRLSGLLTRRGFDENTVETVLHEVVGDVDDDDVNDRDANI